MEAGMVIRVESDTMPALEQSAQRQDAHARYERLVALALRMGSWLNGPHGRALPEEEWERQFLRYQEHLEQVRRLGDELRPVTLRDRREMLAGDALVDEVLELFAA
ncbi:MAG: hypothetical protein ACK47B_13075 [Armatimonadota bacterium]